VLDATILPEAFLTNQAGFIKCSEDPQWVPARGSNPIQQARRHAESLRQLLRQASLGSVLVYPLVVLANDQMRLESTVSMPIFFLSRRNQSREEMLGRQGQSGALAPEVQQRVENSLMAPVQAAPLPPPPPLYKTATQLVEESQALYQAGQFEVGLVRAQQALQLDPHLAVAHNNMSAALTALQRYPEALQAAEYAISLTPTLAAAHSNKALALVKLRRYLDAVAACDQAIWLNPALKGAYNVKGLALLEMGYPGVALKEFDYALTLDARMAAAHQNRGVALARLGRQAEAQQAYQQARQLGYVGTGSQQRKQQK
jgi:tetratricopeptide (TPR) repeat protein